MGTNYSYDEFLRFVAIEYKKAIETEPDIRYGQVYFNTLWEFRPVIANMIRATEYDVFHLDSVSPEVHVHIEDLWLKWGMDSDEVD